MKFVKDNALASANYSTDYVQTSASTHKESKMQVELTLNPLYRVHADGVKIMDNGYPK